MNKEELAEKLNGVEYPFDFSEFEEVAKENGLVIMIGESDDLLSVYGSIRDEFSCFDGGEALLDDDSFLLPWDSDEYADEDDAEQYFERKKKSKKFEACWDVDDSEYAWEILTNVPCVEFDGMEDGEKFSRGIVFSTNDLK